MKKGDERFAWVERLELESREELAARGATGGMGLEA
jgi:hypothetical protein